MKSGGYLALVNPCSGGHIGPQSSSSSDQESSVNKDQQQQQQQHDEHVTNCQQDQQQQQHDVSSCQTDHVLEDEEASDDSNDNGIHNNNKTKSSKLKRSLTLHERKKSKTLKYNSREQIPANRGPDSRFVVEAVFKPLVPKSNSS